MAVITNLVAGLSLNFGPFAKGAKGAADSMGGMERAADRAKSAISGMGVGIGSALAGLAAGFGAAKIGEELLGIAKSGSELNANISKTKVIFGDSASVITKEADSMAAKFGVVKSEFIDAAASFGSVFKGAGKTEQEAAALGNQLAKLGMDMASLEGVSSADAFTAISSALRGEMDPIEKFRVFLSADKVAAEALAMGLAKSKDGISELAKKSATLNLILKGTRDAQGDLNTHIPHPPEGV